MTGTAETESEEFKKIYKLDVYVVPTNEPVIRDDDNDRIYRTEKEKFNAIVDEIEGLHRKGQPILCGTVSVEKSEKLSNLLRKKGIELNDFLGRTEERKKHFKGITVRRGGRLGVGAVILPGIEIGADAVVGAGSVVTRHVPSRKVVMGSPAKIIRDVDPEQLLENQGWE